MTWRWPTVPSRPRQDWDPRKDEPAGGFWWCLRCRAAVTLLEPDDGRSTNRCARCHSPRVEWKEEIRSSVVKHPQPLMISWEARDVDQDARTKRPKRRLPAEERDLRVLARTGYFFCYGCREITRRTEDGCCELCDSDQVQWNEPVFADER